MNDDSLSSSAQTGPQCEECEGSGRIYGATHDGSRTCGECNGRGYMLHSMAPAAQLRRHGDIEPRRFADVRPDRHGWRWWRLFGSGCDLDGTPIIVSENGKRWTSQRNPVEEEESWSDWRPTDAIWRNRTVIPTNKHSDPISWESIASASSMCRNGDNNFVWEPNAGLCLSCYQIREAQQRAALAAPITQSQRIKSRTDNSTAVSSATAAALQSDIASAPALNRFTLLECDLAEDPAASIAAWERRAKRNKL